MYIHEHIYIYIYMNIHTYIHTCIHAYIRPVFCWSISHSVISSKFQFAAEQFSAPSRWGVWNCSTTTFQRWELLGTAGSCWELLGAGSNATSCIWQDFGDLWFEDERWKISICKTYNLIDFDSIDQISNWYTISFLDILGRSHVCFPLISRFLPLQE